MQAAAICLLELDDVPVNGLLLHSSLLSHLFRSSSDSLLIDRQTWFADLYKLVTNITTLAPTAHFRGTAYAVTLVFTLPFGKLWLDDVTVSTL